MLFTPTSELKERVLKTGAQALRHPLLWILMEITGVNPFLVPRFPFHVSRSTFPVPRFPFLVSYSPFPVLSAPRSPLPAFKDLDGRFDPSLTALTKRSQTLSNGTCVSRILSAGVWDRLWPRKGLLLRYTALLLYTQLCCKSTFLSKRKLTYRECCMVNLLSWSLNEGQLNLSH